MRMKPDNENRLAGYEDVLSDVKIDLVTRRYQGGIVKNICTESLKLSAGQADRTPLLYWVLAWFETATRSLNG